MKFDCTQIFDNFVSQMGFFYAFSRFLLVSQHGTANVDEHIHGDYSYSPRPLPSSGSVDD